jgi:hypothetical protein
MIPKNKALAVALFGTWIAVAPVGCSSQVGAAKPKENVVQTEDGGEEEDLTEAQEDPERDEFGRPKEDQQAGFWVSAAYLGMTLASSLLPFLMLL